MLQGENELERAANPAPGFRKYQSYCLKLRPSSSLHQVIYNEAVVAASDNAIIVHEADLSAAVYFPRADVDMDLLDAEDDASFCLFKGIAKYWSVTANGKTCEKVAWSYDDPFDEFAALGGYIAFYMDKLDCYWRNGIELPLVGPGPDESGDCQELQAA